MVNIIMPAYNAHTTIRQAVSSVCMQDNLNDIKLTIVDDCSDNPYDYLLKDFHYLNIKILRKSENTGCGQSRQFGIEHTDCEFFMFLDADDCLYTSNAVNILLSNIKDSEYDVVVSDFIGETDLKQYIIYHHSDVWMHGKIYRTAYIKQNDIKFNMTRTNEDSAYNAIILYSHGKIKYINDITYLWKHNDKSITRQNMFLASSMHEFIENGKYVISGLCRLKANKENILKCIVEYLVSFYAYYILFLHNSANLIFLGEYLIMIKNYYKCIPNPYISELSKVNIAEYFYTNSVIKMIIQNNILMTISFFDFINQIK